MAVEVGDRLGDTVGVSVAVGEADGLDVDEAEGLAVAVAVRGRYLL